LIGLTELSATYTFASWKTLREWDTGVRGLIGALPTYYPTNEPTLHGYMKTLTADSWSFPKLEGNAVADSFTAYKALADARCLAVADLTRRAEPFRLRLSVLKNRRFCVTRRGLGGKLATVKSKLRIEGANCYALIYLAQAFAHVQP
jgi:hypothetical protein